MKETIMQESGVEWIGAIPQGWKIERLKNVSTVKSSNVDKKLYKDQMPVRLCNYVDVYYNDVINSSIEFMQSTASELEYKKFHLSVGDVVLTKDSETPNDIAVPAYIAEDIDDLVCGYHLAIIQGNYKLNGKFLFRAIQSNGIKEQFYKLATGITRFGLKIRELESVLIPIPPYLEQQAIAQYLDERCGKLDNIIAIKQQQIKTLDALRQSIIYQAVTKGLDASVPLIDSGVEWLGEIPKNWKLSKLRYEISIKNGDFISNKLDHESEYPVVGGNGFMGRTDNFNVKGDIIVIGRVGAYCGNVHYINEKAWVSDNALIVDTINNKKFFTYLLNSFNINSIANKTAQPVVTATNIKAIYIPIPKINEQQAIADHLDQETQRLDLLKANLNQQINVLSDYKKSLIYECVTGKKRVINAA